MKLRTFALLAPLGVALAACGSEAPPHGSVALDPVEVTVLPIERLSPPAVHSARVVAEREIELSTRIAGTLARVAPIGTRLSAGDEAARIADADVQAAIARAEAGQALAARTLERIRRLHAEGAASTQELDRAVAAEASAASAVAEARAQLAYTSLTTPVAGTVAARMMDAGDLATPGMPVVRIVSTERMLHAELPADLAAVLAVGDTLRLRPDDRPVVVRRISPAVGARSRRVTVEMDAPRSLRPGEIVEVAVPVAAGVASYLPSSAIVRRGQLEGVFTVEADTLRLRWVRLGRVDGDRVELLSGPAGLDAVVLDPGEELRDGAPVSGVRIETPAGGDR